MGVLPTSRPRARNFDVGVSSRVVITISFSHIPWVSARAYDTPAHPLLLLCHPRVTRGPRGPRLLWAVVAEVRYNVRQQLFRVARPGGDVIHRFVFHNDELVPVEKARWSPGQAGLICGWGLFTTARIVQGEAFAYERHWRRLEKDAALTRLPLTYTSAKVRVHLQEVIRANKVQSGCARIYVVWNSPGYWKSDEKFQEVDLVITTADLPHYPEAVRLAIRQHGRHAASPLAGVKTISWLDSVWAAAEAQHEGFDEVVLLNERGEVSECTAANIFAVKNGKVLTPPLNSGCLEGVTRGVLLEIAADAGTGVVEQTLRLEDLY